MKRAYRSIPSAYHRLHVTSYWLWVVSHRHLPHHDNALNQYILHCSHKIIYAVLNPRCCSSFLRETDKMKSYCLSDISPSRTHNRRDRSPGYRLCYVTEQYVPRIAYLKERVKI
jgi:hypothetical protein